MINLDPNVDQYITLRAGEQKVLEVPKHWAALIGPGIRMLVGLAVCTLASRVNGFFFWMLLYVGWLICLESCWRSLQVFRDRFVITTVRVFRFTGVFSTKRATIPLGRFTDSTVRRPWLGQLLGYGHLRIETAGQTQDLEKVKFVRDIDKIDDILRIFAQKPALEKAYESWSDAQIRTVLDGS